jgi:hypothetical protein
MELSHDERRRLRSIERQLHDDPDLARRLNEWPPAPWAATAFSIPLVAIGTIGVLAGLLVASLAVVLVSGVIPILVGIGLSRRHQRPRITDWMDE